ncbi:MAG: fibronectin type III domain-containing protein [Patescibacteria group bacterium]|nr:fibronectin type III domain-containing protein [Patescibacteria group bacterium]
MTTKLSSLIIVWSVIWLVLILAVASVRGQSSGVTLAWNPSISTNLGGYKLYYGPATNTYTNAVAVGNVTNAVIAGLIPGCTYHFAATAVATNGTESRFSNEAVYLVPTNQPDGPTYLIAVQTSTNLITWSNSPIYFRLVITRTN